METEYHLLHFVAFMILLLLMNPLMAYSASTGITTDQASLMSFKSHITSDPLNVLANNWTINSPVCTWTGVTCGLRHHRVTAITLVNLRLEGSIPPEIGNLSFLVSLNMSFNHFRGILPPQLGYLSRLKVIDLSKNELTGELPPSIFNMTSLKFLLLRDNSLSGELPDIAAGDCDLRELRIARNNFQGRIPSSLGRCSQLEMLTLVSNSFAGVIPANIFNVTTYRVLLLAFNNLTGSIPQEIGRLQNLESLGLEYNSLTGAFPSAVFNSSSLRYLSLINNSFFGSLPQGIANFTRLQTLLLGHNLFAGRIPQEIAYMHELDYLALQFNSFNGSIPPGIFNITKLTHLNLNFNQLSGKLPATDSYNLPNLEELFLSTNSLEGQILYSITNSTKLETLELTSNHFSGMIPFSLGSLSRLRFLGLAANNFTRDTSSEELSFFTSLTRCRYLEAVSISKNPLDGTLPRSIGNFSSALKVLLVGRTMIEGEIPEEIGNLSSVEDFVLAANRMSGKIPETIRGLQSVQRLYLGVNQLTGSLPDSVCTLQDLGQLDMIESAVSGPIPDCLGYNLSDLSMLDLSRNRFDSVIPNSLWNLRDLTELDLSWNVLRGPLNPSFGALKAAVVIDLSNNELSGSIPSDIGGLQRLINLSLAHNRFEGSIPETLSSMLSLERLDLAGNNLTGVIPLSMASLVYLNYFNVSFNGLGGEIPSGGPFGNFTNESFMSNRDFCGVPRLSFPPCKVNSNRSSRRRMRLFLVILVSLGGLAVGISAIYMLIQMRQKKKVSGSVGDSHFAETLTRISYYQLQQATDVFSENNLLGRGGFGVVYRGVLGDGTVFAVKVFNLEVEGALKSFDAECEVLKNLRHRNLSRIITGCSNTDFKALILEYMPNGSVERWIHSPNHFLDIVQRLNIMIDVASALEYLHYGYSTPVVHCDLKPSNVLLDEDMVAHVSDFGLTKLLGAEDTSIHTSTMATIGYMAPEYGTEGTVSPACDVYSYGIMLMEVFTGTRPSDEYLCGDLTMKFWVQNSLPNAVDQIVDERLINPDEPNVSAKLKCLTSIFQMSINCTAESPRDRTSIRDVLPELKKIKLQILSHTSTRNT